MQPGLQRQRSIRYINPSSSHTSHRPSVSLQLKRPLSSCSSLLSTLPFISFISNQTALRNGGQVQLLQLHRGRHEGDPGVLNGVTVDAYATVTVEVADLVKLEVVDATNVQLFGSYSCPADVTALLLVYEDGCVKLKVAAVGIISKLLHTVVGLVVGLIQCVL